jgi:hypothetical protein
MAVIVPRQITIGKSQHTVKTYQPPGAISKEERIRADKLDSILQKRIPEVSREILSDPACRDNIVRRWYSLGRKLREIVDARDLVLQEDISSGLIWQAVASYLPREMLPERSNLEKPYEEKQHKRQDHFSLCYELSRFSWDEVKWIKTWSFVHEITARPALLRDKRIFISLGQGISLLAEYPASDQFREMMKVLAKEFPTKSYRESLLISDQEIQSRVTKAVNSIVRQN